MEPDHKRKEYVFDLGNVNFIFKFKIITHLVVKLLVSFKAL
jgi:hypothetical protein